MARIMDEAASAGGARADEKLEALLGAGTGTRHRRRRLMRWLVGLVVLALLAAGAWSYLAAPRNAYRYTTADVTRGDLTVTVTATGSVQPTEQVDVSSELSGRIASVHVDYNSVVKVGDVLAELVTDNLQVSVESAEAKLAAARASVAQAEATVVSTKGTLDRRKILVTRAVSTEQELIEAQSAYDGAEAALDAAKAQVLVAEADLRLAETNLSKAAIVSPIDGVVLTRSVDPGATVAASLQAPTLFEIAGDLRKMELQVDVDEADVGEAAVGQEATFTVDAYPERRFPAAIRDIRYAPETTNDVVTYKALLTVDNSDLLLRPGMTATADIVVEALKSQLLLPNAALRYTPPATGESGGGRGFFGLFRPPRMGSLTTAEPSGASRTVWVLRGGEPLSVSIEVGSTDGVNTVVTSGALAEGDAVIVDATAGS